MLLTEAQEKLAAKLEAQRTEIKTLAECQSTWTAEQHSRWEAVNEEYDTLSILAQQPVGDQRIGREDFGGERLSQPSAISFRDQRSGETVRAIRPSERLTREEPPIRFGDAVRAIATGQTAELPEHQRRALSSLDTAGGYLLGAPVSNMILDYARANSVCVKAGMQTLAMTTSEIGIARVTSDPVSHWRGEAETVASSDLVFGQIVLRPQALACIVPCSIELLEDSVNAGSLIESVISQALAVELDRACLVGTGAGSQPLGISATPGINSLPAIGYPEWNDLRNAVAAIVGNNYPKPLTDLSWIASPRTMTDYDGITNGDGDALTLSPMCAGPQRFITTSLLDTYGTGADSLAIVGDFSETILGLRTNVVIRVLESGSVVDSAGTTWNAASQLLKLIVCYLRADFAVLRPNWFSVLTGITS